MGKPRGPDYSEEERELILTAYVLAGRRPQKAHELLKADGNLSRVPDRRLIHGMAQRNPARVQEISAERAPQIEADLRHRMRAMALRTIEVVEKGVEQTDEKMPELNGAETARAVRDLSVAGGIVTDKLLVMEGRPTEIVAHRNPEELLRAIEEIAGRSGHQSPYSVALEPEVIPDAVVVEESTDGDASQ